MDEQAAKASPFEGLVACGCHTLSIAIWLMNREGIRPNILAGFGWDELRFPNPVRPGDRLSVTVECLEKRESASKPNSGIVRTLCTVSDQKGREVLRFKDTILVATTRLKKEPSPLAVIDNKALSHEVSQV